jgi:hypothetical protein
VPAGATDTEILIRLGYAFSIDETVGWLRELMLVTISRLVSLARSAHHAYDLGLLDLNQFFPWY